jgi:uncharacterized protein YbjQ (UPF0145 family)
MKKILLGIILGIIMCVLFLYFGGSEYVKDFGQKTVDVGEELEEYEESFKDAADRAMDTVEEEGEKARETVEEKIDETKEKVKEYIP